MIYKYHGRNPDRNPLILQVQLGEELLAQGDVENGVEHLSLAVAVCGQPHSLLGVLQQTLPPQIYQLLLQVRSNDGWSRVVQVCSLTVTLVTGTN